MSGQHTKTLNHEKVIFPFISRHLTPDFNSIFPENVFGITGGAALANTHLKVEGISSANKVGGVTAGAFADIPVAEKFSFQPVLNFLQKGAKSSRLFNDDESKLTVNYVEQPLNFLFKP